MGGVIGKTYTSKTAIVYEITNCYTTSGEVIPSVGYEKPQYFVFKSCNSVSESDIINMDTTLTYGDGGYSVVEDGLVLSVFAPKVILGDINGDGEISLFDAIYVLNFIVNKGGYSSTMDINADNSVNLLDVIAIFKAITI